MSHTVRRNLARMSKKIYAHRGALFQWLRDVAATSITDECIEWPFGRDKEGYGIATENGKRVKASHVVLRLVGQPRPAERPNALHSCDNPPCCNPRHLSWGTLSQNTQQAYDRGRKDVTNQRRGEGARFV